MRLSSIVLLAVLFMFCLPMQGQQKFILNAEVGGKVFLFGSLSLESYWEKPQFGIGMGAGFNSISRSNQFLTDSATNELVEFSSTELRIPLTAYIYKTFGRDKHRLFIPLGYSTLTSLTRSNTGGETSWNFEEVSPLPFAGMGYELHGEKVIFRLPVYVLYLGDDPSNIFPDFLPWLGMSFGFRLG
ncbi:MAG: hypothetical protein MRZ79_02450 [Bacteroidia bacterium]|nr:hypothetical protein [Bacteroidia bacterium]